MSDRLDLPNVYYAPPTDDSRLTWRGTALRAVAVLMLFAAGGIGGGYLWRHLWTPPPGEAASGSWVPIPVEEGLQNDWSAVGWYVVAAFAVGLVLGLLTALVLGRAEIVAVVLGVLGSALAAYLVLTTGERLSPPDADQAAATAADGTRIRGDLELEGWTPLLSLPTGTLLTLTTVFLVTNRRGSARRSGYEEYVAGSYPTRV
jgi:hypothetical protein